LIGGKETEGWSIDTVVKEERDPYEIVGEGLDGNARGFSGRQQVGYICKDRDNYKFG
jgi:hypothetical protein